MSVIIKGMQMPTSCTMCWLNTLCGVWNIETVKHKGFNKRLDACPLTELIRCKDCEHWNGDDDETFCSELGIFGTDQNSFCSYARKAKG